MKKTIAIFIKIIGFLSFSVAFSHCDLFGDSENVIYNPTWYIDLGITTSVTNPNPLSYTANNNFDSNYDPYVIRYKNKIKQFKVKKVTYEILYYKAEPGIPFTNGTLKLYSSGRTLVPECSIDFQNTFGEVELDTVTSDGLQEVTRKLNDNGLIDLTAEGTLSSTEAYCYLRVNFYVTIITGPL